MSPASVVRQEAETGGSKVLTGPVQLESTAPAHAQGCVQLVLQLQYASEFVGALDAFLNVI